MEGRKTLSALPEFPSVSRGPESTEQPIGLDVQSAVIAAIPDDRRGISLAMRTGIRISEARALNAEDWERDRPGYPFGVLHIRHSMQGKNENARRGPRKNKRQRAPIAVDPGVALSASTDRGCAL